MVVYWLSVYLSSWTHRLQRRLALVSDSFSSVNSLGYPLFGSVSYVLWASLHASYFQALWLHDIWALSVAFSLTAGHFSGTAFPVSLSRSVWSSFLFLSICFLGFVWKA